MILSLESIFKKSDKIIVCFHPSPLFFLDVDLNLIFYSFVRTIIDWRKIIIVKRQFFKALNGRKQLVRDECSFI